MNAFFLRNFEHDAYPTRTTTYTKPYPSPKTLKRETTIFLNFFMWNFCKLFKRWSRKACTFWYLDKGECSTKLDSQHLSLNSFVLSSFKNTCTCCFVNVCEWVETITCVCFWCPRNLVKSVHPLSCVFVHVNYSVEKFLTLVGEWT